MQRPRSSFVFLLAAIAGIALTGAPTPGASAQRRPRAVPFDAAVQWTVFVASYGDQPAHRSVATAEPGSMLIPIEGWQCTYSAPSRARLNDANWSEVRTLECSHGDSIVSTTGFCQVSGASWGARAGVLSLGTRTAPSRVQVTLDCSVID